MMVHTTNTPERQAIETRLTTALTTIARLAENLNDLIGGHGRVARFGEIRRRNPRSTPPCNLSWLQLSIELQDLLKCGVLQARADGITGVPRDRSGEALAWWLADHSSQLAVLQWVGSSSWWSLRSGSNGVSWLDEVELYADTLQNAINPPEKYPPAGSTLEVATWCDVSATSVRNWRRAGKLQGFWNGKKWTYRTADVMAVKEMMEQRQAG
ncbi:helix-turn-helix domain-containing protein [Enterococcus faecalis]|uniref:helix-turn-helix domain-containing protein n=1 Tax=Enterococcus faecalis TaxID=1351 RepID=UPI00254E85CF|nr:helix-turn-helix domain-containing protein [Enterococcus faecalis]MDK8490444.1 helix-turn-helix domain-containing protein [Enterococcus faecalis]